MIIAVINTVVVIDTTAFQWRIIEFSADPKAKQKNVPDFTRFRRLQAIMIEVS